MGGQINFELFLFRPDSLEHWNNLAGTTLGFKRAPRAEAANRGAYAGVVHGIAFRPKSKPKPAATPAGGPPQPHPRNPRAAFAKDLGPSPPPWTAKARYVDCVLVLIYQTVLGLI